MRFEIRHRRHREEFQSESDFVVFGRDPSCDVVVKDPRCSRRHASLRVVPEGFHLLDLGSSNGVFVLGQRVDDALIAEGDVFSMGDAFVRILPDEMPPTLAARGDDDVVRQASRSSQRPRSPAPPPAREDRIPSPVPSGPRSPMAGAVLGGSSVLVGLGLVVGPMSLRSHLGVMAYTLAALGIFCVVAGIGLLGHRRWARTAHYAVFAICTLTCLLAPFGIVGLAYQLEGEGRPATDPFFAVVIGLAAAFATLAMVVATLAAGLYFPAPLPL